jgi:hypothetical protein
MQVAKVRPDDIPMGLLALQVQFDQIGEDPLKIFGKRW